MQKCVQIFNQTKTLAFTTLEERRPDHEKAYRPLPPLCPGSAGQCRFQIDCQLAKHDFVPFKLSDTERDPTHEKAHRPLPPLRSGFACQCRLQAVHELRHECLRTKQKSARKTEYMSSGRRLRPSAATHLSGDPSLTGMICSRQSRAAHVSFRVIFIVCPRS